MKKTILIRFYRAYLDLSRKNDYEHIKWIEMHMLEDRKSTSGYSVGHMEGQDLDLNVEYRNYLGKDDRKPLMQN